MTDWQPMDTAPKDGTRILIWDCGCEIASWRTDTKGRAWWSTGRGSHVDPKFWAPLPKPPVTKS